MLRQNDSLVVTVLGHSCAYIPCIYLTKVSQRYKHKNDSGVIGINYEP